jgi:hypothetical protein
MEQMRRDNGKLRINDVLPMSTDGFVIRFDSAPLKDFRIFTLPDEGMKLQSQATAASIVMMQEVVCTRMETKGQTNCTSC